MPEDDTGIEPKEAKLKNCSGFVRPRKQKGESLKSNREEAFQQLALRTLDRAAGGIP